MIRGTTPTHTFVLPFDVTEVKKMLVLYAQNDVEILRKQVGDCQLDGNMVALKLTQEETLKFDCKYNVQIQIKVLTDRDDALVSDIMLVDVERCLSDEVL